MTVRTHHEGHICFNLAFEHKRSKKKLAWVIFVAFNCLFSLQRSSMKRNFQTSTKELKLKLSDKTFDVIQVPLKLSSESFHKPTINAIYHNLSSTTLADWPKLQLRQPRPYLNCYNQELRQGKAKCILSIQQNENKRMLQLCPTTSVLFGLVEFYKSHENVIQSFQPKPTIHSCDLDRALKVELEGNKHLRDGKLITQCVCFINTIFQLIICYVSLIVEKLTKLSHVIIS